MTEIIVALIGLAGLILQSVILRKQGKSDKRQADAKERTEILLEATEASLIGLKQLGANGRVTECLHTLEAYKNKKSAE
ncbi:MAG: hypothetical protein PUC97_01260 [bacterium]|nr:hypothetical protein [bacterium]